MCAIELKYEKIFFRICKTIIISLLISAIVFIASCFLIFELVPTETIDGHQTMPLPQLGSSFLIAIAFFLISSIIMFKRIK
jgi:hypothetical protein